MQDKTELSYDRSYKRHAYSGFGRTVLAVEITYMVYFVGAIVLEFFHTSPRVIGSWLCLILVSLAWVLLCVGLLKATKMLRLLAAGCATCLVIFHGICFSISAQAEIFPYFWPLANKISCLVGTLLAGLAIIWIFHFYPSRLLRTSQNKLLEHFTKQD